VSGDPYPRFAELPVREEAPPQSSWGVFGDDDQFGTLNFAGAQQARRAASLVRRGETFPLNWDVRLPAPAFFMRHPPQHTIFEKFDGAVLDDWLDSFYLQGSTQWDGLRHFADTDYGFYNGAKLDEVSKPGPGRLGMEHWAGRGIVARGVLLDVQRVLARDGIEVDPFDWFPIEPKLLQRVARDEGVEIRPGDVLLVRTGWVEAYSALAPAARDGLADEGRPGSPGLAGIPEMPAFLWDSRIAAVAADNPALEVARRREGADLSLHKALIPRLGMPLGELWDLGRLAEDCVRDGVYEFLLTSAPINLPGAAGTPANAVAVK
jgi:kynurenine formamidase